jgi:hypothetical protein
VQFSPSLFHSSLADDYRKLPIYDLEGLTVATNALRIEYSLTNSLSVRAEAGTVSGLVLFHRKSF